MCEKMCPLVVSLCFICLCSIQFITVQSKEEDDSNIEKMMDELKIPRGLKLANSYNLSTYMDLDGVVPDVIRKAPANNLTVEYSSGKSAIWGNILTPTEVKDQPKVSWDAEADKFYLLCLTDPDAPSRKEPKFREWHHWLVGNIPGSDVGKGETLSEYIGSGPPPETGLHRYVFLVYLQPGKIDFKDVPRLTNRSGDNRANFKIQAFADKYNLGDPVAASYYRAEYDDYVPILYKQLGG